MQGKRKVVEVLLVAVIIPSLILVTQVKGQKISDCNLDTDYMCSDGSNCIPKNYLCNNYKDCDNNDDEENCDEKLCRGDLYFKCRDGIGCISKSLTCNNVSECSDNSDESDTMCDEEHKIPEKKCSEKEFKCEAKVCIPNDLVCDGVKNCFDGRDEDVKMCKSKNITCPGFMCTDGSMCLPYHTWVCDNHDDCKDGSDELNCDTRCIIEDGNFLCKDGTECVRLEKVCDGKKDCFDGSDEAQACSNTNACNDINCDGKCKILPSGPTCICKQGYIYNNATRKCEDINECNNFGVCTQGCVNTNGSYYCTCANRFFLKNDKQTCVALGADAVLLYTTPKQIKSIHLRAREIEEVRRTKQAVGVAYDGEHYYWTDVTDGKEAIIKSNPDLIGKEIVITAGLETPEDLAVDWLTGNIYFTDANLTHIAVCSANGYSCTQLVSSEVMDKPRSIALHPTEALMFWTDWGKTPHIGVAFMDGSRAKVLVDNMKWPNGISLDWPNGRLYWVDAKAQTIESVTIDGKDRRVVLSDMVKHPYGVAVFEDKLYWSDWDTTSIESCNKFTGKNCEPLVQGELIYDIHIFHQALMPSQKHACVDTKCSHICLLAPEKSFTCACPENMELIGGSNCQLSKKPHFVILGVGKFIVSVLHQTFGRHVTSEAYQVENEIDCLEFNSHNGQFLIAHSKLGRIKAFDMENKVEKDLVNQHVMSVTSMGFDYLANNIYWVDSVKSTIEVFSLNTNKRAIVSHFSRADRPIALSLVPSRGEMFVALKSEDRVHIDRQFMKGGHDHFHVIESGLSPVGQVYIAVDEESQQVYWSDSEAMKIEFSNFEGTNTINFVQSNRKAGPLTLVDGQLYWTSLRSMSLQTRNMNRTGGVKLVTIEKPPGTKKTPKMIAIATGTPWNHRNHLCMVKNGGCSDICVSDGPDRRTCLCETGHFFKDSSRTTCVKRNNCGFTCSTSGECLESSQRCNDHIECLDGSDEKDCKSSRQILKCGVSQFMCKDEEKCIPLHQRCDQHYNCKDRSDELNCTAAEKTEVCKDNQLRCPNGHCLDVNFRCDGTNDCGDMFDEREDVCLSVCPADFFKCASGQCIPKEFECNSFIDCKDITDEHAECPMQICKPNERVCPNSWCIDAKLFCDGHEDCADGFDELGCPTHKKAVSSNSTCDEDDFACTSSTMCYTIGMKCDGKNDCNGGEDERNCPKCPNHKFECSNEKCISMRWVCDGSNDCGDNSDEVNCDSSKKPLEDRPCTSNQFKCKDGKCLDLSKVCDLKKDCKNGDDEDEGENGKCQTACKVEPKPCEKNCKATPKGALCTCDEGFSLINGKYCEDIDECKSLDPCSQRCTNTNGSFTCSCHERFILGSDRKTCKALGAPKIFLFALYDQIRKFTEFPNSIKLVDTENLPIADFDINMSRQKIIFTLKGDDEIIEMDMENNSTKVSFEGAALATKIAHDWITGNTYTVHHADDMKVKINVCDMKSKSCAIIRSLEYHEEVTAIRVDPINKLLFYAQLTSSSVLSPTSKIVKLRLDGSDPQIIANGLQIKALAIDVDQQKVYFTETLTQSLHSIDYSGNNSKPLITQSRMVKRPIAMAIFENFVYILKQASQMISRCKLYGDLECHEFDILSNNARQMVIGHQSTQKLIDNSCENHSCEFVCIPADAGNICLDKNGTTVEPISILKASSRTETLEDDSSSGFWLWTFITIILVGAFSAAFYLLYWRRGSHGRFNVSMYFRNHEVGKGLPQGTKPTPFPRTVSSDVSEASAPTVNTLNKNCHELVNDEFSSNKPMSNLNLSSTDINGFSDDENDDKVDFSNDPHQRLIF